MTSTKVRKNPFLSGANTVAGVPRNGVPRQPSHYPALKQESRSAGSGEAHRTRLSTKPGTVRKKVADFGYPAVHEAHRQGYNLIQVFHADRTRRA